MTGFWKFFLRKEHFTVLLMVVLVLTGIYSVVAIPKEADPAIVIPIGVVTTTLPGASASDVEQLVTNKLEDGILGLEDISKVTSTSADGVSSIEVQFTANANVDKSIQALKDEVNKEQGTLPTEAKTPSVTQVNFSNQPVIVASISGDLAPGELTSLGQSVQSDLERVSGVSSVDLSGVQAREVQVIVQQAKLQQYNLSVSTITSAIEASGLASPEGSITVDNVSYNVRFDAGLNTPEDVANISLIGPGGTPLHVSDVANVVDGLQDPTTYSRVSVAGAPSQPALTLSIYKSSGGNVAAVGDAVKQELTNLQKSTLSGTKVVITSDAADVVSKDLNELTRAGAETVGLVIIILLLTLGWREAFVAALSVPFSFLIAFIGLDVSGNTINFISLFALILAIGILVDSGIVVVEAIHTHLEHAESKFDAAISALHEYSLPLVAGTCTTIAVFIPLFFISGTVGKFIASIPFTIIFVLFASIFVALGMVPLLAVFFVKAPEAHAKETTQDKSMDRLRAWYQKFLSNALHDKKFQDRFLWAMGILFVIALALPISGIVQTAFFPADSSDTVYVQIEKPVGTVLDTTDLATREVEELLYKDKRIDSFVTDVGEGSAFTSNSSSGSQIANITITLKKGHEDSSKYVEDLRKELTPVTDATVTVSGPSSGPSSGSPVSINFSGTDETALAATVEAGAQVLSKIPGTTNVTTSTKNDSSEFVVSLDTAAAANLGVSPAVVASTLRTALYGTQATTLRSGTNNIDVYVKLDLNPNYTSPSQTTNTTIDSIRALTVPGTSGPVPLSSIASVSFESAQTQIDHENGVRIVTLSSDLTSSGNASVATNAFVKKFTPQVPSGVKMLVEGDSQDIANSFRDMVIAFFAGIALMLAILVLEFNSFRQSLYLLAIIPLSLIGVFVGLLVTGSPLSFTAMLGVVALAGVIINHAIILMDSIARIGREHQGQTLNETVVQAASIRLRPILLTTVTTVIGMIPLSLVSSSWGPLAFTIMFGLTFSMLLTLLFIPIVYSRWPGKTVRAQFAKENKA
ncbi:MAG: efflux RND transporter permease subunit [Candidatus Pacebacteria bacterium]|nr:efflux RND transporter permease subunit [Candidatus Paceibacterota bacterium]